MPVLRTPDRITTLRPGSGKNGRKMAVFVRGRPSSCFRLSGPETDFRNGRAERPDACRSGVRGRDGAVRRRCVRIAGRGRVLRTGTKGGLYAGGTFPGVGSVRAVVAGRADGQRAGIAKEGRSASRRPERSVAGKSVAGNLPCEARNRTGENEVGKGPPFRGAVFCCRCLLRRSCRFATSGRRIGYRRFSAGILSSHEEIPTRVRPFAGAHFVVAAWRRRRTPAAGSGEHVFGA